MYIFQHLDYIAAVKQVFIRTSYHLIANHTLMQRIPDYKYKGEKSCVTSIKLILQVAQEIILFLYSVKQTVKQNYKKKIEALLFVVIKT